MLGSTTGQPSSPPRPTEDYCRARRAIHWFAAAVLISLVTKIADTSAFTIFEVKLELHHPGSLRWFMFGLGTFLLHRFWIEYSLCDHEFPVSRMGKTDCNTTAIVGASALALCVLDAMQHLDDFARNAVVLGSIGCMLVTMLTVRQFRRKLSWSASGALGALLVISALVQILGSAMQSKFTEQAAHAGLVAGLYTFTLMLIPWQARIHRQQAIEEKFLARVR